LAHLLRIKFKHALGALWPNSFKFFRKLKEYKIVATARQKGTFANGQNDVSVTCVPSCCVNIVNFIAFPPLLYKLKETESL
jgi:hypothetical protein